MMVLRNGQQVSFNLNEQGDLVQESEFRAQGGWVLEVQNFLLPLGENDKIIVVASNLGLARQMVGRFVAVQEEEAEGRKVAQEVAAEEAAAMEDHILEARREGLHRERRDLVNLYVGDDRKAKITDLDRVIGTVEEEQAKRAGFASSDDLISALGGFEFVGVQDADHLAYLLDVDEDEKSPAL